MPATPPSIASNKLSIRCCTNNRAGFAPNAHAYRRADNMRIAAKPFPELIGENHHMVLARSSFFRQKVAAETKRSSQHPREPGSNDPRLDVFGLVADRNVEGAVGPGVQILKRGVLALPLQKVSRRSCCRTPALRSPCVFRCFASLDPPLDFNREVRGDFLLQLFLGPPRTPSHDPSPLKRASSPWQWSRRTHSTLAPPAKAASFHSIY